MQVNLSSEGGLVIRYGGTGDAWGVSATANMQGPKDLLPTSTKDFTQWTYAQAASSAKFDMKEDTYVDVTDKVVTETGFVKTTANKYAIMEEFYIRSSNPSQVGKGLSVSNITVTRGSGVAATQDINDSMKVGLKWSCANGQNGYLIMSPLDISGTRTSSYNYIDPETSVSTPVTMKVAGTDARLFASDVPVPAGTDSPVKVQVYVWFEGQDTHLYSDNVNATEDLKISIEFSADSYAAATVAPNPPTTINLYGKTVDTNTSETIGGTPYYLINDAQLDGLNLYTTDTSLTDASPIFTITGEVDARVANSVTDRCTFTSN